MNGGGSRMGPAATLEDEDRAGQAAEELVEGMKRVRAESAGAFADAAPKAAHVSDGASVGLTLAWGSCASSRLSIVPFCGRE